MKKNSDFKLYFDAAATTYPRREVVEYAVEFPWYNPSSVYRPGVETRKEIDRIRKMILDAAGANAREKELIFTSGGTESNNMAIHSALRQKRRNYVNANHAADANHADENGHQSCINVLGGSADGRELNEGCVNEGARGSIKIWTSGIDHSSIHETVLACSPHAFIRSANVFDNEASDNDAFDSNAFKNKASDCKNSHIEHTASGNNSASLCKGRTTSGIAFPRTIRTTMVSAGISLPDAPPSKIVIREIPVDRYGHLCLEEVDFKDAALICLTHVNNEIGTIADVEAVYRKIRELPARERPLLVVDGVQAFGKISPSELKKAVEYSDFYSISAHKIHGLKGVGALIANKKLLQPFHTGGDQEGGLRGGTENTIGIAAFGKAVELLKKNRNENMLSSAYKAKLRLLELLEERIGSENYVLNTPTDSTPFILSVSLRGVKSEVVIHSLAEKGILVSAASACSSTRNTLSRVIRKIGTEDEFADGTIRISLPPESFYSDPERPLTDTDYVYFAEELAKAVAEIQKYQKMQVQE